MFHIEARQGSRRVTRLNIAERELTGSILKRWVRGEKVEIGEITWTPSEALITVIEGPEVPIGGMTLGRGWPTAQRQGRDVTAEVLERARREAALEPAESERGGASSAAGASTGEPTGEPRSADLKLLADSLGIELLRRLRDGDLTLLAVWHAAGERHSAMSPARTLEIATAAVSSLAESGLVTVVRGAGEGSAVQAEELAGVLSDMTSWSFGEPETACRLRRL